jgi:FkbM family methyltransferase
MNKPLKVLILSNWSSSEDTKKQFTKYDPYCDDDRYFEFVSTDDIQKSGEEPMYYFICNFPIPLDTPFFPKKTIVMQLEPKNFVIKAWGPWSRPDTSLFLDVRTSDTYMNGMLWHISKTHRELLSDPPVRKTKVLSTIMSSKFFDVGHIFRINFIKYLEENGVSIDVWGHDNQHNFRGYKGPHPKDNKNCGILPYKYYFHAENNYEYNFITEKLWDSVMAECVCFYYGCPNISEYVDPSCYVLLDPRKEKFQGNLEIVKRAIENDEWGKRIDAIRKEKIRLLNSHSTFKVIEETIKRDREPPVYVIMYCCTMGKGEEILKKQLRRIKNTQLYSRAKKIFIFCAGPKILDFSLITNRKIIAEHLDLLNPLSGALPFGTGHQSQRGRSPLPLWLRSSEYLAIKRIGTLGLEEDSRILYVHTYGVNYSTTEDEKKTTAWRNYMEAMLIDHYSECLEKLKEPEVEVEDIIYDTVGTEMIEMSPTRHYSGNFWWMKMKCYNEHISKLNPSISIENWAISDTRIKAYNIWSSGKESARELITEEDYKNVFASQRGTITSLFPVINPKYLLCDGGDVTNDLVDSFLSPVKVSFAKNGMIALPLPTGGGECRLYRGTENITIKRGKELSQCSYPYLIDKETGETLCTPRLRRKVWSEYLNTLAKEYAEYKLLVLQKCITLEEGDFKEEHQELIMSIIFIKPNARVLEVGGNVGRNSLIISTILDDENNLVVLECNRIIANKLRRNRDVNRIYFHIEVSALSKKRLMQRDYETRPLEDIRNTEGWSPVNIISFDFLQGKYGIIFDTLVLDCEGAFYEILRSMPECLENIKTIILVNDSQVEDERRFVNETVIRKGFNKVFSRNHPSDDSVKDFYEVFQKDT